MIAKRNAIVMVAMVVVLLSAPSLSSGGPIGEFLAVYQEKSIVGYQNALTSYVQEHHPDIFKQGQQEMMKWAEAIGFYYSVDAHAEIGVGVGAVGEGANIHLEAGIGAVLSYEKNDKTGSYEPVISISDSFGIGGKAKAFGGVSGGLGASSNLLKLVLHDDGSIGLEIAHDRGFSAEGTLEFGLGGNVGVTGDLSTNWSDGWRFDVPKGALDDYLLPVLALNSVTERTVLLSPIDPLAIVSMTTTSVAYEQLTRLMDRDGIDIGEDVELFSEYTTSGSLSFGLSADATAYAVVGGGVGVKFSAGISHDWEYDGAWADQIHDGMTEEEKVDFLLDALTREQRTASPWSGWAQGVADIAAVLAIAVLDEFDVLADDSDDYEEITPVHRETRSTLDLVSGNVNALPTYDQGDDLHRQGGCEMTGSGEMWQLEAFPPKQEDEN